MLTVNIHTIVSGKGVMGEESVEVKGIRRRTPVLHAEQAGSVPAGVELDFGDGTKWHYGFWDGKSSVRYEFYVMNSDGVTINRLTN